jgi:rhodanese-related sulfurtransferase
MTSNKSGIGMAVVAVALVAVLGGGWWALNQNVLPASIALGNITAMQAQEVIQAEAQNPEFVILDVRTPDEYKDGHVDPQGAELVNLDFYDSSFKEGLAELDKSKVYMVYCRSGNRSSQTLSIMEEMGFESVYHMSKGFNDWSASEMPTEYGS